jgi:hypothetical protein
MTDDELIKFGKQVCALSELRVSITRDPWKAQLQEARAAWRIRDLNGNVEDLVVREGTREQVFSKRFAFEKLHRDKRLVSVLANLVNRADVFVVDGRYRAPPYGSGRATEG